MKDLKICGTYRLSILDISRALSAVGVAHIINNAPTKTKIGEGPARAFIADGLRSVIRRKGLIIVVDSKTALTYSNVPIWDASPEDIISSLHELKQWPRTTVVVRKPTIMSLVNQAVTPSFLTDVQTLLYRISNHALRKAAQQGVISYLNSETSKKALLETFGTSYAFDALKELIARPTAGVLREAVSRFRKGEDIKRIEKDTKCSSFDIMYLVRSYDRMTKE